MKRVINGKTYSKVLGIKQGSLLTAGKDGDIEEYKADPTDAGKVLTVGEDGSVAPAGGVGGKYKHNITLVSSSSSSPLICNFSIINDSQESFTTESAISDEILSQGFNGVNDLNTLSATGGYKISSDNYGFAGVYGYNSQLYGKVFLISGTGAYIQQPRINFNTISDVVIAL